MAWRCKACHYALNSDQVSRCVMCHVSQFDEAANRSASPSPDNVVQVDITPATHDLQANASTVHTGDGGISSGAPGQIHAERSASLPSSINQSGKDTLNGRVSHIEQRDERPPFNIYRTMSWVLISIVVFVPFSTLFICFGLLSFSFAVVGFQTLSQFFNPLTWTHTLVETLEVIVLRRFMSDDRIPIFRGMIEDGNSREHSFMMFGPLQSGNIIVGQNIELTGQWRRGSFIVQNGTDLTTNAEITSAYRDPWRGIFFFILGLEAILGMALIFKWQDIVKLMG